MNDIILVIKPMLSMIEFLQLTCLMSPEDRKELGDMIKTMRNILDKSK